MKKEGLFILFIVVNQLVSILPLFSQKTDLPYEKDTINGQVFYRYPVEKSVGLYRISVIFGVSQDDIIKYNPAIKKSGLRYGETVLLIPVKGAKVSTKQDSRREKERQKGEKGKNKGTGIYAKDTIDGKVFYRYPVEKSIGMYRIGVNFDVSQEDILKYNPSVQESGLRVGDTLLIPVKGAKMPQSSTNRANPKTSKKISEEEKVATMKHLSKKDTSQNVKSQSVTDIFLLREDNQEIRSRKGSVTRNIAVLLPLLGSKLLLSNVGSNFWDFYYGVLLGAQKMTSAKYRYNLHIFDVGRGQQKLDSLLLGQALDTMDAILGPVYTNQVVRISEWSEGRSIPVIIPFLDEVYGIEKNPNLYQFNMSASVKNSTLLRYFTDRSDSLHFIFVNDNQPTIPSVETLKKKIYSHYLSYSEVSLNQILNDSIIYFTNLDRQNVVIFNTERYKDIEILLPAIKKATNLTKVMILGEYSWREHKIGLPMLYCSVFTEKYRKLRTAYNSQFTRYFGQLPDGKLLRYDLLGYDLINQVGLILDNREYQPLQSDIRFVRIKENGGYINNNVYIFVKGEK